MATVSDEINQENTNLKSSENKKISLLFIGGAIFLLIVFAILAGSFLSDDGSPAGENSGSQQEDIRARP